MKKWIGLIIFCLPLSAEVIFLSEVDEVRFKGEGTLHISQADHNEILVQNKVNTQVNLRDHLLEISGDNCFLAVKNLQKLTLDSNSKVKLDGIKTINLQITLPDSGETTLSLESE